MQTRAGTNATILQKFQQATVALINTTDQIILSRFGMSQQEQTTPAPAHWAFQFTQVAVWTSASAAQSRQQFGLKIRRDGMLQAFRLIVHLEPFHAKDFEEHAFDQVMPQS